MAWQSRRYGGVSDVVSWLCGAWLPQVQRIFEMFSPEGVAVLGLHTVFEHQAAMTPVSLKAFAF